MPNCPGSGRGGGKPLLRSLMGMAGKDGRLGPVGGAGGAPPSDTASKTPKKSLPVPPTVGTLKSSSSKILTGPEGTTGVGAGPDRLGSG